YLRVAMYGRWLVRHKASCREYASPTLRLTIYPKPSNRPNTVGRDIGKEKGKKIKSRITVLGLYDLALVFRTVRGKLPRFGNSEIMSTTMALDSNSSIQLSRAARRQDHYTP